MIRRKLYAVSVVTLEPSHIGGKEDPLSAADQGAAAVGRRICIPGPSLKGAYRAELERWLNEQYLDPLTNRWKDETAQPCIPAIRLSDDEKNLVDRGRFRRRVCEYKKDKSPTICPVCYLLVFSCMSSR